MEHQILTEIITLLAVSVVFVAVFRRLRLPPILGYLFVGIAIGPHALGWFDDSEVAHVLGEIGVAFLLFTIGLEFSLPQFLAMRNVLLGLGGAQVLLGTLTGGLIAWWIGIPLGASVVVGGALAMSSTAIVVKQLTDQLELQARHGNLALGILLFQDLAAIPFLVIIPILATGEEHVLGTALAFALVKALIAVGTMLALGRWALRPLFHEVARSQSTELFTLTVLLVTLVAAWITGLLGLSLALGAFLAGMMLSETEYRHQIEGELRPFKDILLGLFFVTVGMQLDLAVLPSVWFWVLLLVAGLVIGKGGLITLLTWWFERDKVVALRSGLVLAHGGEFGFALLAVALSTGLLDRGDSQPILAGIIVTMLVAPLLVRHNRSLAAWLEPVPSKVDGEQAEEIAAAVHDTTQHVIICGYGRVGGQLASLLRSEDIPCIALDLHPQIVKAAWEDGDQVFYGDATHPNILEAVGLHRACALVISFDDEPNAIKILRTTRVRRPDLPILVRSRDESNIQKLVTAGATHVIPETLETSLMLTINLMVTLNIADDRINACVRAVREGKHALLRETH